jgi:hypothetical protein
MDAVTLRELLGRTNEEMERWKAIALQATEEQNLSRSMRKHINQNLALVEMEHERLSTALRLTEYGKL